jgi:hypothetical protein
MPNELPQTQGREQLQTLDLALQFFDLFRLAARLKWLGLIHPPYDKRLRAECPEKTSDHIQSAR